MAKFILELPEEAVAVMEQTRIACDISTIEELVLGPFKIFIPAKSQSAAAVYRAREEKKKNRAQIFPVPRINARLFCA